MRTSSLINSGLGGLSGRFLRSRKLRALLVTVGVALGVALIASMTVLGSTLQASITDQLREGFGMYDVRAGYPDRLLQPDEQSQLLKAVGIKYSVGVLLLAPNQPETAGVDMRFNYIGIGNFPSKELAYPVRTGRLPGPGEFVTEPRIAGALGLKVGESVTLPFKTGPQKVKLVGLTTPRGKDSGDSLQLNLNWLQQQMGLNGQVSFMLYGLQYQFADSRGVTAAAFKRVLPNLDVELRGEMDQIVRNMGGLKPMAIAFGIAGLFASVFLVAGSFGIAVQERTRELALLRAVGADQRQVMRLVLQEAMLLGALGSLLGVVLGTLGAWAALGMTATSLGVQAHALMIPWVWLATELAGGVALAVFAARRPARAAGQLPPLQAMRPDAQAEAHQEKIGGRFGFVLMVLGVALVALALALESGSGFRALTGAVGGLAVVAGLLAALSRMLPSVVAVLARPLGQLFPAEATLAGRAVLRHRKRNALTASTLVLGVMLLSSVTTVFMEMIHNGDAYIRSQFPA
ncbi:MAG TPA: ABC transporter permease, partial [Symbiobacteriaceae bacterium]|nr:ABC transporter permease [Symbiobacteriaceae bacterium]